MSPLLFVLALVAPVWQGEGPLGPAFYVDAVEGAFALPLPAQEEPQDVVGWTVVHETAWVLLENKSVLGLTWDGGPQWSYLSAEDAPTLQTESGAPLLFSTTSPFQTTLPTRSWFPWGLTTSAAIPPRPPVEYLISPYDLIHLSVWDGSKSHQADIQVDAHGEIQFQMVNINVSGLTEKEAESSLNDALSSYYLNPLADLRVTGKTEYRITVLGAVRQPSNLTRLEPFSVFEALGEAGGADTAGDISRVTLLYPNGATEEWDLFSLLGDSETPIQLIPDGTVLYIPFLADDPRVVHILGEVAEPGSLRWTADMTILEGLAGAKGTKVTADNDALLLRADGSQVLVNLHPQDGDFDLELYPGDALVVKMDSLSSFGTVFRKIQPFIAAILSPLQIIAFADNL